MLSEWGQGRNRIQVELHAVITPNSRQVMRIERMVSNLILQTCGLPVLLILAPRAGEPSRSDIVVVLSHSGRGKNQHRQQDDAENDLSWHFSAGAVYDCARLPV